MKLRNLILPAFAAAIALSSCESDEVKDWNDYADWREANDAWLHDIIASGKYQKYVPEWNEDLSVIMRFLNDRSATEGNLTPLYTSSVKVKYKGWLYDGTPFDSSYVYTDSCATLLPSSLIDGWVIALANMRVGDKVELIVPYDAAYGTASYGAVNPYSNLRFELELRDVVTYEVKPAEE